MVRTLFSIAAASMFVGVPIADAQRPKRSERPADPPAVSVPPKMCRIWLDGVRADSQPAPTDCAAALRNRPPNGRVIFGKEGDDRSLPRQPAADSTRPPDDRKGRPDKRKKP